jgi:hypothetical protein
MNTKAYVILFSLFLAACGGGGSDSGVTVEVAEVAETSSVLGSWQDASDARFTYKFKSNGELLEYKNGSLYSGGFWEEVNDTTADMIFVSESHRCIMESDDSVFCSMNAGGLGERSIGRLNRIN